MRQYRLIATLALLGAAAAFGQRPDFSGTWKQVSPGGLDRISRIEHRDPYLKVVRESRSLGGRLAAGVYATNEYSIGGGERVEHGANGRQAWISAAWANAALVFIRIVKDGYRVTVTRETWALSDDARTLTAGKRVIDMDGVREESTVFERQ